MSISVARTRALSRLASVQVAASAVPMASLKAMAKKILPAKFWIEGETAIYDQDGLSPRKQTQLMDGMLARAKKMGFVPGDHKGKKKNPVYGEIVVSHPDGWLLVVNHEDDDNGDEGMATGTLSFVKI